MFRSLLYQGLARCVLLYSLPYYLHIYQILFDAIIPRTIFIFFICLSSHRILYKYTKYRYMVCIYIYAHTYCIQWPCHMHLLILVVCLHFHIDNCVIISLSSILIHLISFLSFPLDRTSIIMLNKRGDSGHPIQFSILGEKHSKFHS